jgi:hypothetical protein
MDQVGWSAKTDEVWVELTQPPLEHLGSVAMGVDVTKRTMTFSAFVGGNERRADARVGHRRWAHVVAVGEAEEEGGDLVRCQSSEVNGVPWVSFSTTLAGCKGGSINVPLNPTPAVVEAGGFALRASWLLALQAERPVAMTRTAVSATATRRSRDFITQLIAVSANSRRGPAAGRSVRPRCQ